MRVHEVAQQLGVSPSAVRKYANEKRLEYNLTPGGQRVFTQEQVNAFLGKEENIVWAHYARDSGGNPELIASQLAKLEEAYDAPSYTFTDKGSGLNENRRGLAKALAKAKDGSYTHLAVVAKDRLTRFGYKYLELLFADRGVTLVVLDDEREKSLQDELLQDFMSLLASFSGKFYKMRSIEHRRLLLERAQKDLDRREEENGGR